MIAIRGGIIAITAVNMQGMQTTDHKRYCAIEGIIPYTTVLKNTRTITSMTKKEKEKGIGINILLNNNIPLRLE